MAGFDHFDEALDMVNNSAFGLQAGIFTRDIHKVNKAWDTLEADTRVYEEVYFSHLGDANPRRTPLIAKRAIYG